MTDQQIDRLLGTPIPDGEAAICDDLHYNWGFGDGEDSTSGPKSCAEAIRSRK